MIGKPIFDTHGHVLHDGKYGIFPFVYETIAKKNSKNKEAGTVEIKATQNVNKEAIRAMLLNNVIPAIKIRWVQHSVHLPASTSPDLNVLDLGLFNVIQSIQYQSFPKNLGELIDRVKEAYGLFNPVLNKYCWITLQCCMEEILKHLGGNNFTLTHKGKKRLERLGLLPEQLEVERNLVQQAVDYLNTLFISAGEGNEEDEGMKVDAD
ncbi:uncharacterized protein LOC110737179 [Chenopodium quinoa]|uniref:uncharacterized protein LOC110737179 n=1 Tax=Chenopodium quinoa TaxID=63459 RepID=UPI000B780142|nr:uncharacterized protein LOC110737179 [Chenopodium quinoa]